VTVVMIPYFSCCLPCCWDGSESTRKGTIISLPLACLVRLKNARLTIKANNQLKWHDITVARVFVLYVIIFAKPDD
jgi:hypothetical protein